MKTIDNLAARLVSLALAALFTGTTLAAIDTLAHTEPAANGLMAKAAAVRPA